MSKPTEEQPQNRRPDLDWYFQQPLETQLQIVTDFPQLAVIIFTQLLENEVRSLAGERYRRERPHDGRYYRWGSNPGSLRIGSQRVPINVPRVFDRCEEEHRPLTTYTSMNSMPQPSTALLHAILHGLGTRNYAGIVDSMAQCFGVSKSQVSEAFKEESAEALREFIERRFDEETMVALLLDGKTQQAAQIVIVLGVTRDGRKVPMGFIQASTENAASCTELLRDLLRRGLTFEDGILVVVDGSKGLRKAVEDVFGVYAVVARCQIHKRRNIVSYLPESEQPAWNRRLRTAMAIADEKEAREALERCRDELRKINVSAASSLEEGLDDCLTLQRLGICAQFHQTFSTTNLIENLNSQISRYTRHVTNWSTSDQRHRWIAAALLEAERNMRRIPYAEKIPRLRAAIAAEVRRRLEQQQRQSTATSSTSRISTRKRA